MPKISALPNTTVPAVTDIVPFVDNSGTPTTRKATVANLAASTAFAGAYAPSITSLADASQVDRWSVGLTKSADPILEQSASGLASIYFPWVIKVAGLINSPLGDYYMYYSTDHDSGAGGIGLAYSDSPLGPFTAYESNPVYIDLGGGSQTETPSVMWDEINEQLVLFYSQQSITGSHGSGQGTRRAVSTNGTTWGTPSTALSPQGSWLPGTTNTGYFRPHRLGGLWFGPSFLGGRSGRVFFGMWYSNDGEEWWLDYRRFHSNFADQVNETGKRFVFHNILTIDGRLWVLGSIVTFTFALDEGPADWAIAPLRDDGTGIHGPPIIITPTAQPWETEPFGGHFMGMVENNTLYVYYRSNGPEGAFGVAHGSLS